MMTVDDRALRRLQPGNRLTPWFSRRRPIEISTRADLSDLRDCRGTNPLGNGNVH